VASTMECLGRCIDDCLIFYPRVHTYTYGGISW
jgi:hypothetical protein